MKHLILVGACYLDTILSVPHFPQEDAKLRATNLTIRRGGNCPNSLEVLQQLVTDNDNTQLHLVSCLPRRDAPSTRRIISSFGPDTRVDFRHCIYREGYTEAASSYIIKSQQSNSRTIVNYNHLPEMTCHEFAQVVDGFDGHEPTLWHFEVSAAFAFLFRLLNLALRGRHLVLWYYPDVRQPSLGRIPETTLACMRLLRQKLPEANISVEVEKPGREGLSQLAQEADVVFYSRVWAESRGHRSATACLTKERRHQGSLGLCTWGADGATIMSQATGACLHCPVESESGQISVVDPVGAGDTFIAGMLLSLIRNDWPLSDIGKAASFAVRLATLKVQREGFGGLGLDIASR
ncbi:Ketohexokinase [Metarhizium brunneum]|uniref:Ketohexokinase n=1 Tax=Metarhizium brunneum TaxID=500148 RepID=A0A7D5ZB24_9HYPO|nr:Ketohexokinase [Metarhizium brunneum]